MLGSSTHPVCSVHWLGEMREWEKRGNNWKTEFVREFDVERCVCQSSRWEQVIYYEVVWFHHWFSWFLIYSRISFGEQMCSVVQARAVSWVLAGLLVINGTQEWFKMLSSTCITLCLLTWCGLWAVLMLLQGNAVMCMGTDSSLPVLFLLNTFCAQEEKCSSVLQQLLPEQPSVGACPFPDYRPSLGKITLNI